jgi:photosystem II stability/assembly factor-like uncharacterized protein
MKLKTITKFSILLCFTFFIKTNAQNYWVPLPKGIDNAATSFAINGIGDILIGTTYGGLFFSHDGGKSWTQNKLMNPYSLRINGIQVNSDGIIFIITDQGSYKSVDNGANWTMINLNSDMDNRNIYSIIITKVGDIFISTYSGLYCSHDNGNTVTRINDLRFYGLIQGNNNLLYGFSNTPTKIFYSNDNGNTWNECNTIPNSYSGIGAIGVNSGGRIFVCNTDGLFSSTDYGNTWQKINVVINNQPIFMAPYTIIISNDDKIFISNTNGFMFNGIITSSDAGSTWDWFDQGLINDLTYVYSFAIDSNGYLYTVSESGLVYRTYLPINQNNNYFNYESYLLEASQKYKIPYNILKGIAKTESNIQQGVANMNGDGGCGVMQLTGDTKAKAASLLGVSENELCENTPAGARLNILGGAAVLKDCMCWANPRIISKADFNSCFQNKTGYTFTNSENDALCNALEVWWWPICYYNGGGKDGYISTSNYPYRIWNELNKMINDISYPPLSEVQYLCKGDLIPTDPLKSIDYYDYEISSSDDQLFPEPEKLGKTPSYCIRWTNGNFNPFRDIIIHTNEGLVYTYTDIAKIENILPCFSLEQNYPNPFNPTTTINYSVPKQCYVTIKIYDALGREIKTLVNTDKSAGNYSIEFNASQLASGIYFYRLQAGEFSQTKKFVLLK